MVKVETKPFHLDGDNERFRCIWTYGSNVKLYHPLDAYGLLRCIWTCGSNVKLDKAIPFRCMWTVEIWILLFPRTTLISWTFCFQMFKSLSIIDIVFLFFDSWVFTEVIANYKTDKRFMNMQWAKQVSATTLNQIIHNHRTVQPFHAVLWQHTVTWSCDFVW